jgi:phosphoribosyl-dephospho-CoA transferase
VELRRHELVRLTTGGWWRAAAQHRDPLAARCFEHWRAHDLPAVVATQAGVPGDVISLGLPAPTAWGRTRYAVRVPRSDVRRGLDVFPSLGRYGFPLARELAGIRVHGSFGWQRLTGLDYVHPHSDLDLLIPVADGEQADDSVNALCRREVDGPRLDGELCFPNGRAVAWREWQAWRAGRVGSVLVRQLGGASLERDASWLPASTRAVSP